MSRLFDDAQSEYLYRNEAVGGTLPFALVCWFNSDSITVLEGLVTLSKASGFGYVGLFARGDLNDKIEARVVTGDSDVAQAISTSTFSADTWHHGCAIFVSTTDIRVLLDNAGKGTDSTNRAFDTPTKTYIGARWNNSVGGHMSGGIAEVAIYDLSAWPGATDSDKADNFEAELSRFAAGMVPTDITTGLIAYWELRSDDDDPIGSFDLTAVNAPTWMDHPPMSRPLAGSTTAISGASGSLTFVVVEEVELAGSSDAIGGAFGALDSQPELQGFFAATSDAFGSLSVLTSLAGSSAGSSVTNSSLSISTQLIGVAAGIFDIEGSLSVSTPFAGSSTAISDASGTLVFDMSISGFSAAISSTSGVLNVSTSLGSSIVEISGVSAILGSLGILTLIVAPTISTPGASGSLSISTPFAGSSAAISDVFALLDGVHLYGIISASSSLNGGIELSQSFYGSSSVLSSLTGFPNAVKLDSIISATSCLNGMFDIELLLLIGGTLSNGSAVGYLGLIPDFEAATLFWRPQDNIIETLVWNTSILKAKDGTEQRIKMRGSPRQHFKIRLFLETNKMNTWFDSVLHIWQKQAWLFPVWTEFVEHIGNINIHDTSVIVDTTYADFRPNSKALIWKSPTEYEVIVISTKTDSQLNLSYSILNNFTGLKYIIPIRTAYLTSSSNKQRFNSEVSFVNLVFAVYDNIDLIDYVVENDYDNQTLLVTPAFMDGVHVESSFGDIIVSDFLTGIFKVESDSEFNLLTQDHIFYNDTKESCWKFRQFLHSLNGRQKTVLIPTFRNDIIQAATIDDFDFSVDIENIKLTNNMGFNELRTYIGFYFTDGTLIIRKITDITEVNAAIERISFNAVLGYGLAVESGDCKICFVDKCRLAGDQIEINWTRAHRNECCTNFLRVKN